MPKDADVVVVGLALLGLVYSLKSILIFLVYPWQAMAYRYWRDGNKFFKLLSIPYKGILRITISGWEKFSAVYISKLPSKHLRKWMLQGLGGKIGKYAVLRYQAEVWCPYKFKIGRGSIIGYNNLLDARNGIEIGENVNFSANVSIYTEQHDYNKADFSCSKTEPKKVYIGNRAWIGPNVIILPGVNIGEGAVCAAGCVITKDVEPFTVVAGIPARKVRERNRNLTYEFRGKESRIY